MANALGYVSETKTGFEGALAMMNLSAAIRIEKNAEKAADGQPDYRIFAGETSTEIGGGWLRKAKASGREYVSITLADPQIGPRKIYANLAPVKGKKGRHVILGPTDQGAIHRQEPLRRSLRGFCVFRKGENARARFSVQMARSRQVRGSQNEKEPA